MRSVLIEQKFLEGATRLGFIDLPGAGEAGLDVDTHFVQRVKHEIDLLLMTKRPLAKDAGWFGPDAEVLRLADAARGGAALEDYFLIFLNRDFENDLDGAYFSAAMTGVKEATADRAIQVLTACAGDREDVVEHLLVPALGHLSTKLGRMDRAAIDAVLEESGAVATDLRRFADDLVLRTERFVQELPNQDFLLRDQVRILLDDLAIALFDLRNDYDSVVAEGAADEALDKGITEAVMKAQDWVASGFGRGGKAEWLAAIDGAYKRGWRDATQEEYYAAKAEITGYFAGIDVSLAESVEKLMTHVAEVMRGHLTPVLVPEGSGLEGLQKIAFDRNAKTLHAAIGQLRNLKIDYGSIVLRVTRPIIREIDREDPTARTRAGAGESTPTQAAPEPSQPAPPSAAPPSPAPSSPATTSAARYQWVEDAQGVRRRVPVGTTPTPAPAPAPSQRPTPAPSPHQSSATSPAPAANGSYGQAEERRLKQGADFLYDELTRSVQTAIGDLEQALRAEAHVMVKALAAAVDQYFDTVLRTNEISREYELLCGPDRRAIWPQAFDGGSARLAADLSRIAEQARHVLAQTSAASDFRMTLRFPLGPSR